MRSKRLKLLLVEDNSDHAELTIKVLQKNLPELEVEITSKGEQCLERLSGSFYDVILLDNSLPQMSGLQVLQKIKEANVTTPVLLTVNRGEEQVIVQALEKGADDVIIKSMTYFTILPIILRRVMETQELKTQLTELEQKYKVLSENRVCVPESEFRDTAPESEENQKQPFEFLSSISHEFRTPLNGILGYAELLRDGLYGNITPEQKEILNNIIACGKHLLDLVNDILDHSRIQREPVVLNKKPCSPYELVEAVVTTVEPLVRGKNLELIVNVEKDLPSIFLDYRKIYQVLLNIVGNAVKFTPEGSVEIGVRRKEKEIEFYVRDTGVGIAKDRLLSLFKDSGHTGENLKPDGLGLGLHLSKKWVELHQGRMGVDSEENRGSTFFFTLPLNGEGGQ